MERRGAKAKGDKVRMTKADAANHMQKRVKLEGANVRIGEEGVKQVVPEKDATRQGLAEPGADNGRMEEENATVTASEHGKGNVEKMMELLDDNHKSGIAYSDFKILERDLAKDLKRVGRFSVPSRLVPIAKKIAERHGDIAKPSSQSDCAANPSFILLCAAFKEMDELKLDQINETKILLWRDAINSALNLRFRVDFAIDHLKRIARAYIGLKAIKEGGGGVEKMEVPQDCLSEAKYFRDKPLSWGLFDH